MWFKSLRLAVGQVIDQLIVANARFDAIEEHLSQQIIRQEGMIRWLEETMRADKMTLVTTTATARQLETRLAAADRDFEWARQRINMLEHERAQLITRLLATPTTPPMHFDVPTIEPKRRESSRESDGPSVGAGTPLDDDAATRLHALFPPDMFRDARESDDPEPTLPVV